MFKLISFCFFIATAQLLVANSFTGVFLPNLDDDLLSTVMIQADSTQKDSTKTDSIHQNSEDKDWRFTEVADLEREEINSTYGIFRVKDFDNIKVRYSPYATIDESNKSFEPLHDSELVAHIKSVRIEIDNHYITDLKVYATMKHQSTGQQKDVVFFNTKSLNFRGNNASLWDLEFLGCNTAEFDQYQMRVSSVIDFIPVGSKPFPRKADHVFSKDSLPSQEFILSLEWDSAYVEDLTDHIKYNPYRLRDRGYYGEMQAVWLTYQGLSYVSVPFIQSIGDRRVNLREGEGKEGYLLEAKLDFKYPFLQGRPASKGWKKRMRLTIDYMANFRMTLDNSKPIVPWSNDVGLGADIIVYESRSRTVWPFIRGDDGSELGKEEKRNFINLNMLLHHYSNGQPPGFFVYSADSSEKRNDYLEGDFSTNYFFGQVNWSFINNQKHNLKTFGLGYRRDLGTSDGTFQFSKEQNDAYGRNRFNFYFDWFTSPNENLRFIRHWRFRTEMGYIVGSMNNFQPNLENDNGKYRFSVSQYIECRYLNHRSVGYFVHFYYGRDYLNVRYDDIIMMAQFGITLSVPKFYPPGLMNKIEK